MSNCRQACHQVWLLLRLKLRDIGGLNQIKYGKDPKKKNRLLTMLVVMALIGVILAAYSALLSFGFIALGIASAVPAYLITIISLIILFFSIYKAGGVLFDTDSYEMLAPLPVSSTAIVISRFLSMYIQNMLTSAVILLPAACVYIVCLQPGPFFYPGIIIGILLIPLIPMTIATVVGALVTAISARMKHKNLVTIVLTMAALIAWLLFITGTVSQETQFSEEMLRNLAASIQTQLYLLYPPAKLFTMSLVDGNAAAFAGFVGLSVIPFILLVYLVQWKFLPICTALKSRAAGKKYQMKALKQHSPVFALYQKDLARYFSSSLYVMNTLVGYVLMVVLAGALLFTGTEKVEQMLDIDLPLLQLLPFLLAALCSLSSTTASAISIEGKQWWMTQSLPVSTKQVFDAKLLVNLTVALPCYVLTELLLFPALHLPLLDRLWLILVPLIYLLFISVLGITNNRRMPIFEWDTEATVIKSSGAMLATMLIGFISVILPAVILFAVQTIPSHLVMGVTSVIILLITALLYQRNNQVDILTIE